MTKTSNSITSRLEETSSSTTEYAEKVESFLTKVGISASISESNRSKDFYSNLLRDLLKVNHVQFGRISCDFSVLPIVANHFNWLHGGAVAAIAERVAIACVRTLEAEDREISLGELVISYLSAPPQNEAVIVDGRVQRSQEKWQVGLHCKCYLLSPAFRQTVISDNSKYVPMSCL